MHHRGGRIGTPRPAQADLCPQANGGFIEKIRLGRRATASFIKDSGTRTASHRLWPQHVRRSPANMAEGPAKGAGKVQTVGYCRARPAFSTGAELHYEIMINRAATSNPMKGQSFRPRGRSARRHGKLTTFSKQETGSARQN